MLQRSAKNSAPSAQTVSSVQFRANQSFNLLSFVCLGLFFIIFFSLFSLFVVSVTATIVHRYNEVSDICCHYPQHGLLNLKGENDRGRCYKKRKKEKKRVGGGALLQNNKL